ncbi:hypothetical protein KZ483_05275 [Paenibacillus sp. sptzw28]|nr:hypothetical protein [Paenibacillus sp. sptzw28]QYR22396.1 hypothetical protein KZ483_05275 [Paenibacillus sp. sptzw28]
MQFQFTRYLLHFGGKFEQLFPDFKLGSAARLHLPGSHRRFGLSLG